jgi:hypothetical protein
VARRSREEEEAPDERLGGGLGLGAVGTRVAARTQEWRSKRRGECEG